jgi:hypothetical protein
MYYYYTNDHENTDLIVSNLLDIETMSQIHYNRVENNVDNSASLASYQVMTACLETAGSSSSVQSWKKSGLIIILSAWPEYQDYATYHC